MADEKEKIIKDQEETATEDSDILEKPANVDEKDTGDVTIPDSTPIITETSTGGTPIPSVPKDNWKNHVDEMFIPYIKWNFNNKFPNYAEGLNELIDKMMEMHSFPISKDMNSYDAQYWIDILNFDDTHNDIRDFDRKNRRGAGHAALKKRIKYSNFLTTQESKGADINAIFEDIRKDAKHNTGVQNVQDPRNLLVFGTPGSGKSYYIEHERTKPDDIKIRTIFYQDYTNADFVGQLLPKVDSKKNVTYEFNPGPFTRALEAALRNPKKKVRLIIEEINRGNAPSIFGDIFQLLDRNKEGESEYEIINVNISDYLHKVKAQKEKEEKIKLPSNLYIFATMNSSDQNVFTLDTAFKRRWEFIKIFNDLDEPDFADKYIPGESISWKEFATKINEAIIKDKIIGSEDKQIGAYFIDDTYLASTQNETCEESFKQRFAFKVLAYIWTDIAKFKRDSWFKSEIKSLDDLVNTFNNKGLAGVFADGIL